MCYNILCKLSFVKGCTMMITNCNLERLRIAVHSTLNYEDYNSTVVLANTNCFSHAIGSTISCIELHRIGAICGKKDIDERYFSVNELLDLLYADIDALELKIEPSFLGDTMEPNQHQIAFFVKIYADNNIHDYHFYRHDSNGWSEKWRYFKPNMMSDFQMLDYFPWQFVGIYKITK